jgi:protease-4
MARILAPLGRLGRNAGHLARRGAAAFALPAGRFVLRVRLGSPTEELHRPLWLGSREPALSLPELLATLSRAARDERVSGLLVRSEGAPGGLARALSIQRALAEVRAAGKPVLAWSESLGVADWLALAPASPLLLPESGSLGWLGLRFEGFFLGELLERLGVTPEVVRVGAFKSAGEMFTRRGLSEEAREQLEAMADETTRVLTEAIGEARGIAPGEVRALADRGPFSAAAAAEAGPIDGCAYPDELEDRVREAVPELAGRDELPWVDARSYAAFRGRDSGFTPLHRELPRIAYVVAQGGIGRGRSARGVGAESFGRVLRRIEKDDDVVAAVLRIDSPGGDVVASDLVWRAARRLAEAKPLVASLGDTAASGGYYAAAAAHAIVAEPATVTGSIGVVGGKIDLSGLYDRLGVGRDGVEEGARAGLFSEARGFTAEERKVVREGMLDAYERFLERVSEGRPLSRDEVHAVGGGRVWTGTAALGHGLVDALGGPLEAVAEARKRAGLAPGERARLEFHPRRPPMPGLSGWLRLLGGGR